MTQRHKVSEQMLLEKMVPVDFLDVRVATKLQFVKNTVTVRAVKGREAK